MGSSPKVSVVIPALNEAGPKLEALLKKILAQEGDFEREVILVDSGSTDGTVELAESYGAIIHRIRKQEFDHGATRKLGISLTRGEYALLTVGDAVPLDERWMAPMVENLERDERVAGGLRPPDPSSGFQLRDAGRGKQPGPRRSRMPGTVHQRSEAVPQNAPEETPPHRLR